MGWLWAVATVARVLGVGAKFSVNNNGAEDEIRTRDPLLGKEMLYH